ncbi:MAG TPA: beta-N-acetylhexosaminidase [Gemmatimonadales bacterium]|nr:beta-N-acetylhexosaminidase [Gemmatimonadales bacterium]
MTLEQLTGQLIWGGWGGQGGEPTQYDAHARFLVEDLQAGGIVLLGRNLESPVQIAELTRTLQERAQRPLLIGIDQEGGRICRLPLPGFTFPGSRALGAIDKPDVTREVSRAIGEQLLALGVNVDFSPTLDINNNPRNPIIGVRAFAEDAVTVTRHGVAAIEGFREAGIMPVVKHFPGHGDTSGDSHLELPCLPVTRERLEEVELVPFRAAIAAGAPAVMTTHILFPALDPQLPSTLSPRILNGLLRTELGFDGLVVTDCLEMKGVADHWSPEEVAVLAIEAGADTLLVCHTRETQARMHDALTAAVRDGRLSEERIARSVARIERARSGVPAGPRQPARVGSSEYQRLEQQVAEASLSLVGKANGTGLPKGWDPRQGIVVAGDSEVSEDLVAELKQLGVRAETGNWPLSPKSVAEAPQFVWTALPNSPFPDGAPSSELVGLLAQHPRAVVVAAREHYLLANYPQSVARLAAWGNRQPNLHAVARWLAGEIEPRSLRL